MSWDGDRYLVKDLTVLTPIVEWIREAGFAVAWKDLGAEYLAPDFLLQGTFDGYLLEATNPPALLWLQVTFGE